MFYFYGRDYFSEGQWNNGDFGYSTIVDEKNYICEWNVAESVTTSISTTFDTSTVTLQEGNTFDFDGIVSTTAEDGLAAVQIDIHKAGDDTVGITYTRKTNSDETSPLSDNSFDLSSIPSFQAGDTLTGTTQSITLSADTSWNIYLYAKDADGNTLGGSVVKRIDIVEKEVPFVAGKTYAQSTNTDMFTGFEAPYFAFNEDNTGKFHWVDSETGESGKDTFTYTISDDTIKLTANGLYYLGNVAKEIVLNIVDENHLKVAEIIDLYDLDTRSIGCTSVDDQFEVGAEQKKPVVSGLQNSYTVTQGDTLNLNFTVTAGNNGKLKVVTVREDGKTTNTYKEIDIFANSHIVNCTIDTNTIGTHTYIVYASADNYTVTDNVVAIFTVTVKANEDVGERITKDFPCTYENVFKAICQILEDKNDGYNEYAKYDWEKNCSDKKGWHTDEFLLLCMTTAWTESNWDHYETDGSVKVHGASNDTGIMQLNTVDVITDEWLIKSITDDWYYNLEYGMGNVWNAYLESKKTYTDETSIARGAYSRYNGGGSAGVTRWEKNPIVQDKNFYSYYQIMKEWFDGNDGGATGNIYKAYEVFCKFYGKIDIPVVPDEPVDEIQVVVYDSNGNVIKEGDTLNGEYTVVISNVPSAYQNYVNIELKDTSTSIIYQRPATAKTAYEYVATFDTSMMYESSYSLAVFAWHIQEDSYKSSNYFNFDTDNDAIYGFKLNNEWITDGDIIRLTTEEAKKIKIILDVTNNYDYLGNCIVHPVEPMCSSSCTVTQVFATVYSAKKLSIYPHIINIESEGTYIIKLSTSKGDRCNITLIVSDKIISDEEIAPEIKGNVFQQNDVNSDWYDFDYLNGDLGDGQMRPVKIKDSGCNILCLTNAVYYMNGKFINPKITAKYAIDNKFRTDGSFDYNFYSSFAESEIGKKYKYSAGEYTKTTGDWWEDLTTHLSNGGTAVGNVPGHLIAIVDYNHETDNVLIYDSYVTKSRATTIDGDWKSKSELCDGKLKLKWYIQLSTINN